MKAPIDQSQQPDYPEAARSLRPYSPVLSPSSPNLLHGVAEASKALLTHQDYSAGICQALAILGRVTCVDRVYIFEFHPHPETRETAVSQRYEWADSRVTPEIDNPSTQNFVFNPENQPQWHEALFRGSSFSSLTRNLSPAERQLLEPQGILSILFVPIPVNGKLWGFIGFDDCHGERSWSKDEEAVLMTMAATLGGVIAHQQTDLALRHTELRLQQIAANVPGMLYQFLQSSNGCSSILYTSSGCRELCELEPEAILADVQVLKNLVHPDDRPEFEQSLALSAATQQPWDWEGRIITPSGKLKWLQGRSCPALQPNGEVLWDGLLMDISKRKRAEDILYERERRLRKQNQVLLELARRETLNCGNLPKALRDITEAAAQTLEVERVGVWLYNHDRSKIHCIDLYELSCQRHSQGMELAAVNFPKYFKTLEAERTIAIQNAQTDPRTQEFTQSYLKPFGITSMLEAPIWLGGRMVGVVCHEHLTTRAWTSEEQNFAGSIADLVALAMEARDRVAAEEALVKSEALYRTLARNFPNGAVFLFDHHLRYLVAEGAGLAAVGLSQEFLEGKTIWEAFSPETCTQLEPIYRATLAGEEGVSEIPYNGRIYVLQTLPLKNEQGEIYAGMVVSQDVTLAKQAEAARRESEEKYAKSFCCSPDVISISTLSDGRYLEVNENFCKVTGYSREQVIGRTSLELNIWVNPEDRMTLRKMLQEQGAVRDLEFEFQLKSGEVRVGSLSAEVITLGGQACLLAVNRDITERKQTEIQLRLAAQRHRLLAEISSRIRRSLNLDQILNTTVTEVRQFLQADRVFIGHTDGKGHGQVVTESVDPNYPSILGWVIDDPSYLEEMERMFEQGSARVVDDTREIVVNPQISGYYQEYQVQALLSVPIRVQGDQLFGALIVNQCSRPRHWEPMEIELLEQLATQVAIAIQQAQLYEQVQALNANLERQVQERTQQLQQQNQELQELSKLKDDFLHAVSHDLRTPIMGTLLVLKNLLNKGLGTGPESSQSLISLSRSILERMIQSGERQLSMINSLLEAHSSEVRGVVLHYESIQLSTLVQAIVEDLEPLLSKNQATLSNGISDDLPLVTADALQLRRVFENLLTNALNHNPPGLHLTLQVTAEAEMLRCTIQDNGIGMSPDLCEHLFDRYVRASHARSTGIGLGLYLCRQIITAHGGQIGVQSTPQAGATFWFTLPLASSPL